MPRSVTSVPPRTEPRRGKMLETCAAAWNSNGRSASESVTLPCCPGSSRLTLAFCTTIGGVAHSARVESTRSAGVIAVPAKRQKSTEAAGMLTPSRVSAVPPSCGPTNGHRLSTVGASYRWVCPESMYSTPFMLT